MESWHRAALEIRAAVGEEATALRKRAEAASTEAVACVRAVIDQAENFIRRAS